MTARAAQPAINTAASDLPDELLTGLGQRFDRVWG